ncbi:hypothetical protein BELL_0082g00240 [Botrytis elliptica]|uniref:Uncharacterized protein n=1 Tax=Botrytis elliptica TaxID=278938 RepID=A0A4Z1JVU9_9HELO|nr:hypothetical protein BELL_0082g00240 [Botrytis elliptica]
MSMQIELYRFEAVNPDEKPAPSYYLKAMSSLNPRAPVFIPSPRPLPPVPNHLAAVNAAGNSFVAAHPNHPLAKFAAEEVRIAGDERALLLDQKVKLRKSMLVFYFDKFFLGTDGQRRVVKSKEWLKKQQVSVVLEYKRICAKLGQRPEVGCWFFSMENIVQ